MRRHHSRCTLQPPSGVSKDTQPSSPSSPYRTGHTPAARCPVWEAAWSRSADGSCSGCPGRHPLQIPPPPAGGSQWWGTDRTSWRGGPRSGSVGTSAASPRPQPGCGRWQAAAWRGSQRQDRGALRGCNGLAIGVLACRKPGGTNWRPSGVRSAVNSISTWAGAGGSAFCGHGTNCMAAHHAGVHRQGGHKQGGFIRHGDVPAGHSWTLQFRPLPTSSPSLACHSPNM